MFSRISYSLQKHARENHTRAPVLLCRGASSFEALSGYLKFVQKSSLQQVAKLIQNFQNVKVSETEMGSKLPSFLHTCCKLDTKFWMYGRMYWGLRNGTIKVSPTLAGPSVTEASEHTESHSCSINFVTYSYVTITIVSFYSLFKFRFSTPSVWRT
jgi:hypothetical protein